MLVILDKDIRIIVGGQVIRSKELTGRIYFPVICRSCQNPILAPYDPQDSLYESDEFTYVISATGRCNRCKNYFKAYAFFEWVSEQELVLRKIEFENCYSACPDDLYPTIAFEDTKYGSLDHERLCRFVKEQRIVNLPTFKIEFPIVENYRPDFYEIHYSTEEEKNHQKESY